MTAAAKVDAADRAISARRAMKSNIRINEMKTSPPNTIQGQFHRRDFLKLLGAGALLLPLLGESAGTGAQPGSARQAALGSQSLEKTKPNFVLILGEGHGWSSTSVQMDDAVPGSKSAYVRTPNFEKLAQTGMRFANFYAPSPRCTPSRASLFTGKSPAQLHMTFINEGRKDSGTHPNGRVLPPSASMELPVSETTIAQLLKRAGYATAHFGKWHVGRANPREHGYNENDGANGNGGPDEVDNPHPKQLFLMTERGMDFMTRQVKAGKPFYLQMDHYASRHGGDARPESIAAVKSWGGRLTEMESATAAADLDLDVAFGLVLKTLDELGIAGNTYVIFTTDHGTPGKNLPLAGGKGTVSEGGLRVPFIMRGPGIKPGVCSHVRTIGEDLLPTVAELAHVGEPLPKGIEGGSLASVLVNSGQGAVKRPRAEFVVHFPHYDKDEIGPASALYLGDFKLIRAYETGALKLFNIAKDPGERRDLAQEMPDKVKELNQRLTDYLAAVNAQMPTPNPDYDPSKPADAPREGKRKKDRP
jgi:arylsulfatase A-like enzyme